MTPAEDSARGGPRHLLLHALLWCGLLLCVLAIARYWDESTTLIRNFSSGSLLVLLAMLLATWGLAITSWQWAQYFSLEARLKGVRLQWSDWKRPSP